MNFRRAVCLEELDERLFRTAEAVMAGFAAGADFIVGRFNVFQFSVFGLGVQGINGGEEVVAFGVELGLLLPDNRQCIAVALLVIGKMIEWFAGALGEGGGIGLKFFHIVGFVAFDHFSHAGEFGHHAFKGGDPFFGNRALRGFRRSAAASAGGQAQAGQQKWQGGFGVQQHKHSFMGVLNKLRDIIGQ